MVLPPTGSALLVEQVRESVENLGVGIAIDAAGSSIESGCAVGVPYLTDRLLI